MELDQYPCLGKLREFTIEAIQIPIVYNKYGDHDPDGLLYVLAEDADRIRDSGINGLFGAISVGSRFDMELKDGAGCEGDYLYRSGSLKWDVESGMWGIFRVKRRSVGSKCKDVCRRAIGFCRRCRRTKAS